MKIKFLLAALLLLLGCNALAAPFTVSADGQEVTDTKTGLVWRRCAEGMTANGSTCTGTPGTFTHEAALTRARAQATDTGVAWRLPNVKELSSITDKSRSSPAIEVTVFPATPLRAFWSSSPHLHRANEAWFVGFFDGYADGYVRNEAFAVRLVRAGQ
jgi:hypothetical protein